ncbi:MAG: DUF4416 family protein [Nitrospirae bacterium]|nr:DUF4416 family protein [Nitrospirota bacterium]MBF0540517.1 DUF4416 family protein [Nitrospirota bacterium]
MGIPKHPERGLLFSGLLYSDTFVYSQTIPVLKDMFGEIYYESPALSWSHSNFYKEELGLPILRRFIFFDGIYDPSRLADSKLIANNIEQQFSIDGKRRINIDPGYMTLAKVVLASTKNYSHRIYLDKGIFAELTLINIKGKFQPLLFTYPDFKETPTLDIFHHVRNMAHSSNVIKLS